MDHCKYPPWRNPNEPIPPTRNNVLETPLWRDKRRPFFGKPLSFTTYTLYADRLMIDSGILTLRQDELRLYRLMDIKLHQTLLQRLFGVGTIRLSSMDSFSPRASIRDVRFPREVMRLLSDTANTERRKYGLSMMECMGSEW